MRNIGPVVYGSETDIDEELMVLGPLTASGNLKAVSIDIKGPVFVKKSLEITGGNLKVSGPVHIGKNLVCSQDINISGACLTEGTINARTVIIKGKVRASSISAEKINIRGSTNVKAGIVASESVTMVASRRVENEIGFIESPVVNLIFDSFYTKFSVIPRAILTKFGLRTRYSETIDIEKLNIRAGILNLIHSRSTDRIEYVFSQDCKLEVEEIRKIQKTSFFRV